MDIEVVGLGDDAVEYHDAWAMQRQLHAQIVAGQRSETMLLLEHQAVFTAGRRTQPHERPATGVPVVDTDRGGKITWHGPGQLVGYPLMRLPAPVDVVSYVRRVEELLMAVCSKFGVSTHRVDGRSGVWVPGSAGGPDRKIAAIGIRVSRRVTMHGFALNCNPDLSVFSSFVPCGISDAGVTSLSLELGRQVDVAEALPVVQQVAAAGVLAAPQQVSSELSVLEPQEV